MDAAFVWQFEQTSSSDLPILKLCAVVRAELSQYGSALAREIRFLLVDFGRMGIQDPVVGAISDCVADNFRMDSDQCILEGVRGDHLILEIRLDEIPALQLESVFHPAGV